MAWTPSAGGLTSSLTQVMARSRQAWVVPFLPGVWGSLKGEYKQDTLPEWGR